MGKRIPAFDPANLVSGLLPGIGAPHIEAADGYLKDYERRVASAVALILSEDDHPRVQVAHEMSMMLAEPVSKAMLDAYASERRTTHNISFTRLICLVAVTKRWDVLAALLAPIGATVVIGHQAAVLEVGQLEMEISTTRRRKVRLTRLAQELGRA